MIMAHGIAQLALCKWNDEVNSKITFRGINIIPSKNPPRYQTKSVIWSLFACFAHMNVEQHYNPINFVTFIGTQALGVGRIGIAGQSPGSETSSTSPNTTMSESDFAPGGPFNESLMSPMLNADDFHVDINYKAGGRVYIDTQIWVSAISVMIAAAEQPLKRAPSGPVASYNNNQDFTLSVMPTSVAATENLEWVNVILAMYQLPKAMLHAKHPQGRWAELDGLVRYRGAIIGKIAITKGHVDPRVQAITIDTANNAEVTATE